MRITAVQAPAAVLLAALALAAPVGATGSTDSRSLDALDDSIVAQINVVRRAHGLAPVRASARLHRSAEGHSRAMGTYGFFAHESRDGTAFWKRIRHDYPAAGYRVWSVGENLAFSTGTLDAAATVRMWMNSPPHRRVLLTPTWRDVGISALHVTAAPGDFGGDDVTLVTADFGIRR
ncbi:MAG TPA: CAP domain-containing protein [Gaiellaceae bacterium]|jgi:uncharacterized protein YkwD|nr:CAP domain-containing protein [Gaiellaceae bacterium]